jgi:NADPH-dependent F420 reductase
MTDSPLLLTIAILGGTGKEGKGLAYRWARAGYHIIIGSRADEKAKSSAQELMGLLSGDASIEGCENLEAAKKANIVVLTVPYIAHKDTIETVKDAVKGKLFIDATVPIVPPKKATVQMPPAGSAAQEAKQILGDEVEVCAAFQIISYKLLLDNSPIECDVLVTGTSNEARAETIKLVEAAGLVGWDAGPIENSVVVEGMASVLINVNKKYGSTHAGIKITGAKRQSAD